MLHSTVFFYFAESMLGLGLAIRASLNYIMLNEVTVKERASTQGILVIFISAGQLLGAALIGSLSSSIGKGIQGFGTAFLIMAVVALILVILSVFLKNRKKELEHRKNE